MKLNIKDYITLPAVNEALESDEMTKDEALVYVTDVAAHVALVDSSSDDKAVDSDPIVKSVPVADEPVDNGIASGAEDGE